MNNVKKKKLAISNLYNYIVGYKDGIQKRIDILEKKLTIDVYDKVSFKIPFTIYYIAKHKTKKAFVICKEIEPGKFVEI